MAGRLEGKVAFITGAGRGQGRSHAIRLAAEGADIIAVDICAQIDTVPYPLSTPEDLAGTVSQVEALDRRIVAREADVRDEAGLKAAFDAGVAELGPVDIVLANAGIAPLSVHEDHAAWRDVIDVNLTGVFNTVEIAIPSMIERGRGPAGPGGRRHHRGRPVRGGTQRGTLLPRCDRGGPGADRKGSRGAGSADRRDKGGCPGLRGAQGRPGRRGGAAGPRRHRQRQRRHLRLR